MVLPSAVRLNRREAGEGKAAVKEEQRSTTETNIDMRGAIVNVVIVLWSGSSNVECFENIEIMVSS